ncbi:MAG: hypothetical protein AAF074_25805 [Pseudomonadota bacterium]
MMLVRIIVGLGGALLTGLIVWAIFAADEDVFGVIARLPEDPWFLVTMVDLYLGFFLGAAVIGIVERRLLPTLLWAAPIFVLGNVWTALWFVLRGWRLLKGGAER